MSQPWNLTADQWASVLGSHQSPASVANGLLARGAAVPWTALLLEHTDPGDTVLDLGSGRGEHSALLARHQRRPVLADWSARNLGFSRAMFEACAVSGEFCRTDISRPLPFRSGSMDVVFSCGVLEYFTPAQVEAIIGEAWRVARKRVIVLVPNAASLAYRFGKWYMERTGAWTWGGEVPSYTLAPMFRRAGAADLSEFTVAARHALDFLVMPLGRQVRQASIRLLRMQPDARPAWLRQGYLLVTIGEKGDRGAA